jgi:transcriptional regulator with XRE-family HTH domain
MGRDYAKIASEFLRALRGRRSQAAFSRRLGYRTNVAYVWESGRAFPTAAKALAAARRAGIDLQAALRRFYKAPPPWLDDTDIASPRGVALLLEDLRGRTSVMDLARATGKSRFAVARWLRGDAEPRLPDFLLLVEKSSLRLLDWIACLIDPAALPSLERAWHELEARRRSAYDLPWTQVVLRTLELTDYRALGKHRPGWIAERIGISLEQERECLELLAHTRPDAEAEHRVKHWWSRLALDRLEKPESGLLSYNVFAVSESDLARIRELHIAYFRQMRGIIAQSTPSERVVIASLSLVALDARAP